MAVVSKARDAIAGEEIKWWGDPVTVAPKCAELDHGSWYCATHEEGFQGNWMVNSHAEGRGRHVLVWICGEHGPEQP